MPERKYNIGEKVMAKWPGSHLYFEGEVEDFNDIEYLVKFDDEDQSKLAIKYRDVQVFRARSQSRGRSPARVSKKSPARAPKAPSKSPARRGAKTEAKTNVSKTSSKGSKSPARSSSSGRANNSTSKTNSSFSSSVGSNVFSLTSSKLDTKTPDRQSARIATFDKSNDVQTYTTTTTTRTSSSTRHSNGRASQLWRGAVSVAGTVWGVVWPALKTLPVIAFIVGLQFLMTQACTKRKCTIKEFPEMPMKLDKYYESKAVGLVMTTFLLQLLLSYIPIKTRVLPNGAKARGNAIVGVVVMCLLIPLSNYLGYNLHLIYTWMRQLLTTYAVLGVVLSLLLYVKSFYSPRSQRNPRVTGHFLPDLVEGREVAPRLGSVDIKTLLFRIALTNTIVFNIVLMIRDVSLSKGVYSPVLITSCVLQIIYCMDLIWFEDSMYSTWEYTKQGTGMLVTVGYFNLLPMFAIFTRMVLNYRQEMPWYCIAGIVLVFLVGYVLNRGSNNQKHAFRTNPSSPALAQLESVPTSAGSRLLVSGWWGVVRHPNYVGDTLCILAMALLCGFNFGLPWAYIAMYVGYMIIRIYQVEGSCKEKYGMSWNNYTSRVRYRLVPKLF